MPLPGWLETLGSQDLLGIAQINKQTRNKLKTQTNKHIWQTEAISKVQPTGRRHPTKGLVLYHDHLQNLSLIGRKFIVKKKAGKRDSRKFCLKCSKVATAEMFSIS